MAKRKDNGAEIDFLREGLKAFMQNRDFEQISITTDFGQIAITRNVKKKGEVNAIGFQYDEYEDYAEEETDEDEREGETWKQQNGQA